MITGDENKIDPNEFGLEELPAEDGANDDAQNVGYNRAIAMLMNLSLWLIQLSA